MTDIVVDVLAAFDRFVLVYFLALNTSYLVLIAIAALMTAHRIQRDDRPAHDDIVANPLAPSISVVVPAMNEREVIVDSTRAALRLRYPDHEVIVVDDGSTDDTFESMREAFDLVDVPPPADLDVSLVGAIRSMHVPRGGEPLTVVRKANAGTRSDAVNAGLNVARKDLVCFVDADSLLEPDALLHVVEPFVDDPERVIATGGVIRAANGCEVSRGEVLVARQPRNWLVRIQVVEYLRSFLLGRTGWSKLGALMIISGAFGLYRRDLVVAVGGFDHRSLGEDFDLLMALHRHQLDAGTDYRVECVPEPVCWTEVPSTREVLGRQRKRWSHGLAQVLWKFRGMLFRRKYRRIGSVGMPYYIVFELLGPIVELVGVVAVIAGLFVGAVNTEFALIFAVVALLYGFLVSLSSLLVEEANFHRYESWRDLGASCAASALENLGFRQLHAWWRIQGLWNALWGKNAGWGEMTRVGFQGSQEAR